MDIRTINHNVAEARRTLKKMTNSQEVIASIIKTKLVSEVSESVGLSVDTINLRLAMFGRWLIANHRPLATLYYNAGNQGKLLMIADNHDGITSIVSNIVARTKDRAIQTIDAGVKQQHIHEYLTIKDGIERREIRIASLQEKQISAQKELENHDLHNTLTEID